MAFGINKLDFIYRYIVSKLYNRINGEEYLLNINRDLLNPKQKRVLLIYITNIFKTDYSTEIRHPNLLHGLQMLSVLINKGYAVDVFHTKGINSLRYIQKEYDYIIGFGPVYEKALESGIKGLPILLLTENDPRTVRPKYQERLLYYKERHNDNKYKLSKSRESFYTEKQVSLSKLCIGMGSSYNLQRINGLLEKLYKINVNGLNNPNFVFNRTKASENRNSFVWFGSNGCIHKGLDILVDVFASIPEYQLSIYGLPQEEFPIIRDKITSNIHYCGTIDVMSEQFLEEVVNKHCFAILPSCSEGMNTGIATCMRHGLIPIVSKETGFEPHECIIELEDFHVDYIRNKVLSLASMTDNEINLMSEEAYRYGNQEFGLESFTNRFSNIIDDIESNYGL